MIKKLLRRTFAADEDQIVFAVIIFKARSLCDVWTTFNEEFSKQFYQTQNRREGLKTAVGEKEEQKRTILFKFKLT